MAKVNYNYDFSFISKIEYSLKYSYQEKSRFMNVILQTTQKKLKLNNNIVMPDEIEVPKEYFKYIEKTQSKVINDLVKRIKKEFTNQYKKELVIISAPITTAKFKKVSEILWDINLEIKGLYRV